MASRLLSHKIYKRAYSPSPVTLCSLPLRFAGASVLFRRFRRPVRMLIGHMPSDVSEAAIAARADAMPHAILNAGHDAARGGKLAFGSLAQIALATNLIIAFGDALCKTIAFAS